MIAIDSVYESMLPDGISFKSFSFWAIYTSYSIWPIGPPSLLLSPLPPFSSFSLLGTEVQTQDFALPLNSVLLKKVAHTYLLGQPEVVSLKTAETALTVYCVFFMFATFFKF